MHMATVESEFKNGDRVIATSLKDEHHAVTRYLYLVVSGMGYTHTTGPYVYPYLYTVYTTVHWSLTGVTAMVTGLGKYARGVI